MKIWHEAARMLALAGVAALVGCSNEGGEVERTAYERGQQIYRNANLQSRGKLLRSKNPTDKDATINAMDGQPPRIGRTSVSGEAG